MLGYLGDDLEEYARAVHEWSAKPLWWDTACSLLEKVLPLGRVVEIGCNTGRMTEVLEAVAPHAEYRGFDVNDKAIVLATQMYPLRRFEVFDGVQIPCIDGKTRTVICVHTLPHVANPEGLMDECHRILSPYGTLVMLVANQAHDDALVIQNMFTGYKSDPTAHTDYYEKTVRDLLYRFSKIKISYVGRKAYPFLGEGSRQWMQVIARR